MPEYSETKSITLQSLFTDVFLMPEIKHMTHIIKCCRLHVKTTESPHLNTESDSASNYQDASYNMGIYSMAAIVGLVHGAQDNFKPRCTHGVGGSGAHADQYLYLISNSSIE